MWSFLQPSEKSPSMTMICTRRRLQCQWRWHRSMRENISARQNHRWPQENHRRVRTKWTFNPIRAPWVFPFQSSVHSDFDWLSQPLLETSVLFMPRFFCHLNILHLFGFQLNNQMFENMRRIKSLISFLSYVSSSVKIWKKGYVLSGNARWDSGFPYVIGVLWSPWDQNLLFLPSVIQRTPFNQRHIG